MDIFSQKAEVEEIEKEENLIPFSFENDPGSNCHGFYDLQVSVEERGGGRVIIATQWV